MKKQFYIWNTKTDQNFDPIEMKFYNSNWEPELTDDKEWLESIMKNNPEKFENCVIKTK